MILLWPDDGELSTSNDNVAKGNGKENHAACRTATANEAFTLCHNVDLLPSVLIKGNAVLTKYVIDGSHFFMALFTHPYAGRFISQHRLEAPKIYRRIKLF